MKDETELRRKKLLPHGPTFSLRGRVRLQRYNSRQELIPYDWLHSRIKLAIDSHCGNKIHRPITRASSLTDAYVLGMTDDWFVLYCLPKEEWVVVRPEKIVSLMLRVVRNRQQLHILVMLAAGQGEDEHLHRFEFDDPLVNQTTV